MVVGVAATWRAQEAPHPDAKWQLHGSVLEVTWKLPGSYLEVTWKASSPDVGSSRKTSRGSPIISTPTLVRFRSPPLTCGGQTEAARRLDAAGHAAVTLALRGALPPAAPHPLVLLVADDDVARGPEAELVDEALDTRALVGEGDLRGQPQPRG